MTDRISGGAFKQMVAFGAACITAQKQAINDLNVFPVPDGDTGTNMSLTIQTAVTELRRVEPSTLEEAAKITASGLLRGARGNSGVILSLLFRGMSKVFKGLAEADGAQLAAAMQEGVTTAYGAVMKPAEGTVLTVSRLAAQRALEAAGEQNSAEYVLDEAIKTGYTTLAETIEMNPVLKKAGVVDAGGKGFLLRQIALDGFAVAGRHGVQAVKEHLVLNAPQRVDALCALPAGLRGSEETGVGRVLLQDFLRFGVDDAAPCVGHGRLVKLADDPRFASVGQHNALPAG